MDISASWDAFEEMEALAIEELNLLLANLAAEPENQAVLDQVAELKAFLGIK